MHKKTSKRKDAQVYHLST